MNGIVKLKPMEKAQARIAGKHIFFAALILSTPFIEDKRMQSAATDMVKVWYNPDFIAKLDTEEIIFTCVHEIMHILLKHGLRRGNRQPKLWNIACDHVINLKLKENKFKLIIHPEWPKPFVVFADPKYVGMSEEQVYDKLLEEQECEKPQPKPGKQKGEPNDEQAQQGGEDEGSGEEGDAGGTGGENLTDDILPPPKDKSLREIEYKIDQDVARAVTIAKARGEMPAGFEHIISEFFEAQVRWEDILARWMSRFIRTDQSWSRRNRRFVNMYLPGKKSQKMQEIDIIGDSSGSMFNRKIFSYVGSEINYMIQKLKPELVRVIWADDAECSNREEFPRGTDVILHPKGGGGTDMRKPLVYAEQYAPQFVILITDGYTPWPAEPTPFPLIVCCTTNAPVPDWAMEVRVTIN